MRLRAGGASFKAIGIALNRSVDQCYGRFKYRQTGQMPKVTSPRVVPHNRDRTAQFAERDRRIKGYAARDLTGQLLNNPPQGYSALDQVNRADDERRRLSNEDRLDLKFGQIIAQEALRA